MLPENIRYVLTARKGKLSSQAMLISEDGFYLGLEKIIRGFFSLMIDWKFIMFILTNRNTFQDVPEKLWDGNSEKVKEGELILYKDISSLELKQFFPAFKYIAYAHKGVPREIMVTDTYYPLNDETERLFSILKMRCGR